MKRGGHLKRKTPLKRSATSLQRVAMRKVSAKTKVRNAEYLEKRRAFLAKEENQLCPVMLSLYGERHPATQVHHKRHRGKYMLDESTWLAVSALGHAEIHDHPERAYEKGWLIKTS